MSLIGKEVLPFKAQAYKDGEFVEVTEQDFKGQYFELLTKDGKKLKVVFGGLLNSESMNHIRRTLESYGIKMIDLT